jgi:hypothetical protein
MKHRYFTLARLVGVRPAHVPEGLMIMNAPAPLQGEATWLGNFLHGNFYAAISPANDAQIESAHRAQAWVIEYLTVAEALVELDAFAAVRGLSLDQYCQINLHALDRDDPASVTALFDQLVRFKDIYL